MEHDDARPVDRRIWLRSVCAHCPSCAVHVAVFLATSDMGMGAILMPSKTAIGTATRLGPATVRRGLDALASGGYLRLEQSTADAKQTYLLFVVPAEPVEQPVRRVLNPERAAAQDELRQDYSRFVEVWCVDWNRRYGVAYEWNAIHGAVLKRLLVGWSVETLARLMELWHTRPGAERRNLDFLSFARSANTLAAQWRLRQGRPVNER
ncbi:MAG: hypothetical protein ABIL09_05300 [Gemmatimonadota bacterium]